jgi:hypothetical protein
MKSRTAAILMALISVASVVATGGWYFASQSLRDSRTQFATNTLEPMSALLTDNQRIITELHTEPYTENDAGILESYLIKIRRDGVAKHADAKQRLDQLAENNTAIVTLIKVYSPHAKTPAFTAEADKFRSYASAWRDRWNSVMELFMGGGNYAVSEVQFPTGFPGALQAEIAAAK